MEAAARGAREAGGVVVGVLPDLSDGNPYLSVRIRTGMGHARNVVLVQSADAVVGVGGEFGTLSELAIALKRGSRSPATARGTFPARSPAPRPKRPRSRPSGLRAAPLAGAAEVVPAEGLEPGAERVRRDRVHERGHPRVLERARVERELGTARSRPG